MKRSLLVFIILLTTVFGLFSCKTKGNTGDNQDNTQNTDVSEAIYGVGVETLLITNLDPSEDIANDCLNAIVDKIYAKSGSYPYIYADSLPKATSEIVIGDTNRSISVKAKSLLENKIKKAALESNDYSDEESALEDTEGYLIYAEGNSVAIVWSDSHLFEIAIKFFLDNYVTASSLKLEDGYTKTETLSLSAYLRERGERIQNEQFEALEKAIGEEHGPEIVESLRRLYTLYKPEAVKWLANLYDPETGGFYYSNSARDNQGFLPDIESTYGVLAFIEETGMAEMYDNDYSKALPKWLLIKIGSWVQSLQDEDGYFYHPQWPKSYINDRGLQSRITRDRGSAVSILRKTGITEIYPMSTGASGKLSGSTSAVVAASKVVATAGVLSQFESVESFRNYINALDAEVSAITDPNSRAGRLYAIGNEFQSTVSLVKQNPEYVTILHEFFKKHQDPNTGTWSSVLTYNATNSLHKIGYVYNALGLKYDYVYEMIDTVIEILSRDVETDPIGSGVDVANAWASIEHIYSNVKRYSGTPSECEEKYQELLQYVYANIKTAIDATFSQLAGFVQQDGSIGYTRYGSSYVSQGCPSAVAGSAEGDVNGYGCASYSVTGYIFIALGLPEYEVRYFSEAERVEFMRIIDKLGEIVKKEEELSPDTVLTFEDGKIPENVTVSVNDGYAPTDGAFVEIEEFEGDKALHIKAVSRNGEAGRMNHSVILPIALTSSNANASVIEFDFYVNGDASSAHYKMIEWAMRSNGTLVLYPTIGKTAAGKVILYDSNANIICELGNVNETIKVRFEYFWAESEYKVYVNDKFRAKGGVLYSTALSNMPLTQVNFYTPTSLYADYYIDNLRCSRVDKYYDPDETVQYPKEPVTENFEGEIKTEKLGEGENVKTESGFSALYSDKYTNNGGATAVVRTDEATGNKFLSVYAPARANGEYSHSIKLCAPTQMTGEPNAFVFETKLKLNSVCSSRNFIQIIFFDGGHYGQLNMSTDENGMMCLAGLPIGYYDEWFVLRLEYHFDVGVIRAYNNGLYMGEITKFTQSDNSTNKEVSALDSISDFSLGTYNGGGSLSFSIDDISNSLENLEYAEMEIATLPAPNPAPDDFLPVFVPKPPTEPVVEDFEGEVNSEKYGQGYNVTTKNGFSALYSDKYTNNGGATAALRTDETTGNKFLSIYAPSRKNKEYSHAIKMANPTVLSETPNALVFEVSLKLNSVSTSRSFLQVVYIDTTSGYRYGQLNSSANENGMMCLARLPIGYYDEWFDLRLEYHFDAGVIRVYNNDYFVGEITTFTVAGSEAERNVSFFDSFTDFSLGTYNAEGSLSFSIDNVALYYTELEYVEKQVDTLPAPNPDPDDFLPVAVDPTPKPDIGDDRETELIDFNGPVYTKEEIVTNGVKVYDSYSFGRVYTSFNSGTTNAYGENKVEIVTQSDGDNALRVFAVNRVDTKDTAPSIVIKPETLDDGANATVVEFSFTISDVVPEGTHATGVPSLPLQIVLRGEGGYVQFGYSGVNFSNGEFKINGVKVGEANKEMHLKFVYSHSGECVYVYSDGEYKTTLTANNNNGMSTGFFAKNATITSFDISCFNSGGMCDVTIDDVRAYNIAIN